MTRIEEIDIKLKELTKKLKEIYNNPSNKNPEGSFYLYKKKARDKTDKISWQIYYLTKEKRELEGEEFLY